MSNVLMPFDLKKAKTRPYRYKVVTISARELLFLFTRGTRKDGELAIYEIEGVPDGAEICRLAVAEYGLGLDVLIWHESFPEMSIAELYPSVLRTYVSTVKLKRCGTETVNCQAIDTYDADNPIFVGRVDDPSQQKA